MVHMGLFGFLGTLQGARKGFGDGTIRIATGINIRELGGFPTAHGKTRYGRFIRSGTTAQVDKADARELYGYGVRRVLDLRGTDEVERSPERLTSLIRVEYLNVPLFDYDITGAGLGRDGDPGGYLTEGIFQMLGNRAAIRDIFTFLAHAPRGSCTLFHCGAGSDRTGLLSLLLLGLAGVERRQIIADYAYSFGYVAEVNAVVFGGSGGADGLGAVRPDLAVRIKTASTAYDRIVERHGDVCSFLLSCGVRESEVSQVRALLLKRIPPRYRISPEEALVSSTELLHREIPDTESNVRFYVNAYEHPEKVIADLYYMKDKTHDLVARIDASQRDRSFHDHDYVDLLVPEEELGHLYAPVDGKVLPLDQSQDPIFASGQSGRGIVIVPSGNTLYTPAACRVTAQLPSFNAVGLLTQDGIELLVVVGAGAERSDGRGFRQHVWQNDSARRGVPLISWDPTLVPKTAAGQVMLIVTNSSELESVELLESGNVQVGDEIASISP